MQSLLLSSLAFGIIGGLIRALVGISKYLAQHTSERNIRARYFLFTLFMGGVVGGAAGALAQGDWRIALLVGYAGTDFLEGLFKLKEKQIAKQI